MYVRTVVSSSTRRRQTITFLSGVVSEQYIIYYICVYNIYI